MGSWESPLVGFEEYRIVWKERGGGVAYAEDMFAIGSERHCHADE